MILLPQDEEDIVDELRNSEEYRELLRMKHIKRLKEEEAETGIVHHHGYAVSKHFSTKLVKTCMSYL